jgi:hypothetical protein
VRFGGTTWKDDLLSAALTSPAATLVYLGVIARPASVTPDELLRRWFVSAAFTFAVYRALRAALRFVERRGWIR